MAQCQGWDWKAAMWPHGPGTSWWLHTATENCLHSHLDPVPSANSPHSFQIQPWVTCCISHHLLSWPFLCHFLPCDPRALPFPFHFPISSTHLKPLLLSGSATLAFGNSAFALLFITSSYLSLSLNSEIVLFSLKCCSIKWGIRNLHFRTCIYTECN